MSDKPGSLENVPEEPPGVESAGQPVSQSVPSGTAPAGSGGADEDAVAAGIPRQRLFTHLQDELDQESACKNLPLALLLWATFAFLAVFHLRASVMREVGAAIEHDIDQNANFAWTGSYFGWKDVYDVNSITDFYSWLNNGLLPLILPWSAPMSERRELEVSGTWPMSDDTPLTRVTTSPVRYLTFNHVIGGIRMRQERAPVIPCSTTYEIPVFTERECHHYKYMLDPDYLEARTTADPQRTVWFMGRHNESNLENLLASYKLEDEGWWDAGTQKVEITVPVVNVEFGMLTAVYVNFFYARSGRIYKIIVDESIFVDWYSKFPFFLVCIDLLFTGLLVHMVLGESKEVVSSIWQDLQEWRGGTLGKLTLKYFCNPWNWVDWFNIIAGGALMIMWLALVVQTADLKDMFQELFRDGLMLPESRRDELNDFMQVFEGVINYFAQVRELLRLQPISLMLRLFKAFSAQPRLSLVTSTLADSAVDMVHFGLVFFSVFFTFVFAAITWFGKERAEFATTDRAAYTCFTILMGEFDWGALTAIGRLEAALWFVPFMILIFLVLLNMLLAIIMDTYTEVKGKLNNAETLVSQTSEIYRRYRQRKAGKRVSLQQCLGAFAPEDFEEPGCMEPLTVEEFMANVQGLESKQARRLLMQSEAKYQDENGDPPTFKTAQDIAGKLEARLAKVMNNMKADSLRLLKAATKGHIVDEEAKASLQQQAQRSKLTASGLGLLSMFATAEPSPVHRPNGAAAVRSGLPLRSASPPTIPEVPTGPPNGLVVRGHPDGSPPSLAIDMFSGGMRVDSKDSAMISEAAPRGQRHLELPAPRPLRAHSQSYDFQQFEVHLDVVEKQHDRILQQVSDLEDQLSALASGVKEVQSAMLVNSA